MCPRDAYLKKPRDGSSIKPFHEAPSLLRSTCLGTALVITIQIRLPWPASPANKAILMPAREFPGLAARPIRRDKTRGNCPAAGFGESEPNQRFVLVARSGAALTPIKPANGDSIVTCSIVSRIFPAELTVCGRQAFLGSWSTSYDY